MNPKKRLHSKPPSLVRIILNAAPLAQVRSVIATGYGLTCKLFPGMNQSSSGSAVAGFPCSKPPLNPMKKASSIKWRLFYIESA